jgi:hypothetical protein
VTTPTKRELRCPVKLHGVIPEDGMIEIQCRSVFCGYRPGIVILHRWSVHTGQLITTLKFKDPRKKVNNGADQHSASIRAS